MTKKIFSSILIVSILVTLVCFSLITVLLHNRYDLFMGDEVMFHFDNYAPFTLDRIPYLILLGVAALLQTYRTFQQDR